MKVVSLADGQSATVHSGAAFHELDVADTGGFWVGTVKSLGWRVCRVDSLSGESTDLARAARPACRPAGGWRL